MLSLASGDVLCFPQTGRASESTQPLPAGSLSLAKVVAAARQQGWSADIADAELVVFDGTADKPPRVVWVMHPSVQSTDGLAVMSAATGDRLPITSIMEDPDQAYAQLASQARQAMAARMAREQAAPQQATNQPNENMTMADRFAPWNFHPHLAAWGRSAPFTDNSGATQRQWNQDTAAQNAWNNGDSAAQNRINAGQATDADRSAYGGGY